MRRRSLLYAVSVAAMALLPMPMGLGLSTSARPELGTWTTITGTTGYVDVHLGRRAAIDGDFNERTRRGFMQIRGDRAAVVVLMSLRVVHGDASAPWVPIFKLPGAGGGQVAYWHNTRPGLPPGDYRVFLIARTPTTVRFFLPGQQTASTTLRPAHASRAAVSAMTDAPRAPDAATHEHQNSVFFTVRHRAMAFGVDWFNAPEPPITSYGLTCTYADDPVGGTVLPGCPGAFLTYGYDVYPETSRHGLTGYAVGPDPAGRLGTGVQDVIVGPITAMGSALYYLEY
jgi:hypothetical protein